MCRESEFWSDLRSGRFASMVKESAKGRRLVNSSEVYHVMRPMFAEQDDVETVYGIFLNAKNRVLAIEKLFSGSISSASVYPREVVKRVLTLKSTAIVLAHNHPSGGPEPSPDDFAMTTKLGLALDGIGVTIHDHIVVGGGPQHGGLRLLGWYEEEDLRADYILII